jgi:hypothetical protein
MEGDVTPGDPAEFILELLFRRVDQEGTLFAEEKLLDLHKSVDISLLYGSGIDLVDLALVGKDHLVEFSGSHDLSLKNVSWHTTGAGYHLFPVPSSYLAAVPMTVFIATVSGLP